MKFRARLVQEFTIEAADEKTARYVAEHRVARFADMVGIDSRAGSWKVRAHEPELESIAPEPLDGEPFIPAMAQKAHAYAMERAKAAEDKSVSDLLEIF